MNMKALILICQKVIILVLITLGCGIGSGFAGGCDGDSCVRVTTYTGFECTVNPYWCPDGEFSLITVCDRKGTSSGHKIGNCVPNDNNWEPPVE
jgi:ABC-type cobalt transport system substrate-binding protein